MTICIITSTNGTHWLAPNNALNTGFSSGEGASGYAAICVSAGTSGGSTPSFSSTPGNIVTDGGAAWQTVSLSHSSLAGGPGLYVLPGNADDNLQTMINSYGGSTAADLAVNVRIR